MLARVISVLAVILWAWSVVSLLYHYVLLFAALRRPRSLAAPSLSQRFAIAIPAHNEEAVIGETLRRLAQLDYPSDRCTIYVVADHCDDRTAERAAASGAMALVRSEGPRGRKAYALQWFCEQVFGPSAPYDALVVIDADSRLDINFLQAMSAALDAGMQVVQGQHIIVTNSDSDYALLAGVDEI
jgi:cellulose synthase/poly-beta-1,6-N-acetylglucosamine synthase-like glycosyltransferase